MNKYLEQEVETNECCYNLRAMLNSKNQKKPEENFSRIHLVKCAIWAKKTVVIDGQSGS